MHNRFIVGFIFCFFLINTTTVFANATKSINTKVDFKQYSITAPFKVSLPIIPLDLVEENTAFNELVLIGIDELNQTWLAVYTYNEKSDEYILLDKIRVTDEYFAFDVSEDRKGLYLLAKNKVVMLKFTSKSKTDLTLISGLYFDFKQEVSSIFLLPKSPFISKKNFIQDVNQDGYEDIVLPDFDKTNLWLFSDKGTKATYQHLAINTQIELERGGVKFTPTALFFADFNLDDRQDIAWVSKGHINYFSQNENGTFASTAAKIALADTIYGVNWWHIKEADGENLDQSNLIHRAVEEIKDINGDGLTDVVVRFTQSSGVLDRTNDYEFYLGYINQEHQLAYSTIPTTVIKAEGTLTDLKIIDVNQDEKYEVLVSSFQLSVGNIIGALLSGGIDQNVLVFALDDENSYEEDALISKEVELNFSLTSGQSGEPIVRLSDVNGDGLQDLVLSSGQDRLVIFLGNQSAKLFARKSKKFTAVLPENGKLFEHYDINHDGKEDFIMRYGRLDDESLANKVTILMVK
ncbi:VCBS repeat-containing protein [Colwellia sp. 6_MG-2023]|uniref:FG-GAP repeat domain-containing protein n=1 Tax=Colwellia sp. 6_MG-2023 TaxID=3062676 RepID=UPI0026E4168C|nr:VCBS repeat-containing protein [Colwellia sp. 6_MG-2023]MDO6486334.1 VCBS repeat-containing protein [Colwellia sp. 6_MG-2023]